MRAQISALRPAADGEKRDGKVGSEHRVTGNNQVFALMKSAGTHPTTLSSVESNAEVRTAGTAREKNPHWEITEIAVVQAPNRVTRSQQPSGANHSEAVRER